MKSQKPNVGILAFGSLISDPGDEIAPLITKRLNVSTPFSVEFGRYSGKTRGGAPTLVPVTKGGDPVDATILVLKNGVTERDSVNMLWRRETRTKDKKSTYQARRTRRAVRVKALRDFAGLDVILYTDFYASGKIRNPKPRNLARRAIKSVRTAPDGNDGISYLIVARSAGVETPLSKAYAEEIMKQTSTASLEKALAKAKEARAKESSLQEHL
ncbi:MAG: hypothetical protein AABZ10_10580 [Nitrospirota bacterium]